MKFLRTASTRRLVAVLAGLVAAVGAGTALAVASSGNGPVPQSKPLALAIHDALGRPAIEGITAQVTFTNHLIDASSIQGSDPILTGATGRLWLSSDHRVRLELQADNGDAQAVLDNGSFWVYDPSSNTVYKGKLPANANKAAVHRTAERKQPAAIPTVASIQSALRRVIKHLNVSGAIPSNVAGQAAYTVRVSPQHDGGLLGAGELAWDAVRGIPLRLGVYAQGSSSPVLELKATNISYGPVPASDFAVTPPSGAKVVNVSVPAGAGAYARTNLRRHGRKAHSRISGPAAVAAHLHFGLIDPATLVGLPRRSVRLLDWGGSPAALVAYGQNLGGIAVIEQTAGSAKRATPRASGGEGHAGLNLPTVSINGVTGQELDTALGTVVRFTRGGVAYTVLGSVPPAAADAAARAL